MAGIDKYKGVPLNKLHNNPDSQDLEPMVLVSCGSFSPITSLHLILMEIHRDNLMLNKKVGNVIGGIISPVHDMYGKESLIDQRHRQYMCEMAVKDIDWVAVADYETSQQGWTPTCRVLDHIADVLEEKFTNHPVIKRTPRVVLCMGSDVLLSFLQPSLWDPSDIIQLVSRHSLAVMLRGEDNLSEVFALPIIEPYIENIHVCTAPYANNISSTLVRTLLRNQQSIRFLVPEAVRKYIYQKGLYCSTTPGGPQQLHFDSNEDSTVVVSLPQEHRLDL